MKIISRAEAKALGLSRFFTGTACKYGHVAERLTANGSCLPCHSKRNARDNRSRRAAGSCLDCTHPPQAGATRCERCAAGHRQRRGARRALKLDQTPDYCSPGTEAYAAIQDVYDLAEQMGEIIGCVFEVDHIIPLSKGGLHEPSNLTPLRADLNGPGGKWHREDWTPPANEFARVAYRRST